MKILSDVNVLAELQENGLDVAPLQSPALTGTPTAPTADSGTNTTQLATTAFVQAAVSSVTTSSSAEKVTLQVRYGEAVSKGDPVYISGYHGSTGPVIMSKAQANDSAKMPAFGLADDDYAENATGYAVSIGVLEDVDTDSYTVGDTLYVAPTGGLTDTKPTGSNLIQNVGTVSRSNANNGSIEVTATGRSNDVPNLTTGKLWVGSVNNTIESTTLHLDETNNRLGIGTTTPGEKLEVNGKIKVNNEVIATQLVDYNNGNYFVNPASTSIVSVVQAGLSTGDYHTRLEANALEFDRDGTSYINQVGTGSLAFRFGSGYTIRALLTNDGNLGIGETSVDTKLHISDSTSPVIKLERPGQVAWRLGASGTDLRFSYNSDTLATAAATITNTGNVGIGTTSPQAKLTVDGESNSKAIELKRTGVLTGNAALRLVGLDTEEALGIQVNDSEKVRIDYNGNVGIGDSNPWAKLTVSGHISSTGNLYLNNDNSPSGADSYIYFGDDASDTGHYITFDSSHNHIKGSNTIYSQGHLIANQGLFLNYDNTASDTYIYFGDGASDTAHWMRFEETGQRFKISNTLDVGGAITGASNLYLNYDNSPENTDTHIYFGDDESDSAHYLQFDDSAQLFTFSNQLNVLGHIYADSNLYAKGNLLLNHDNTAADSYVYFGDAASDTAHSLSFSNSTQKFTLTDDLIVAGDLTVNGTMTIVDTDVNTTEQLLITNDGTGPAVIINQTGSQPVMRVQDDSTTVFEIVDGGNTHISNAKELTFLMNGQSYGSSLYVDSSDNTLLNARGGSGKTLTLRTYSGSAWNTGLVMDDAGKVGIGTASPSEELTVVGDAVFGNSSNGIRLQNGAIVGADTNGSAYNDITLRASSTAAVTIDTSSNVGIGTTTPSEKLDVVGNVKITGTTTIDNVLVLERSEGSYGAGLRFSEGGTTNWEFKQDADGGNNDTLILKNADNTTIIEYEQNGNVSFNSGKIQLNANGNMVADGNLYLNNDLGNNNTDIYFGDPASSTNHYLRFDNASQVFRFSDPIVLSEGIEIDGISTFQGTGTTTGSGTANGFSAQTSVTGATSLSQSYAYVYRLTTTGTGTNSGATYVVDYDPDNTTWNARAVALSGTGSNHPLLDVSTGSAVMYTNHSSGYTIRYSVTRYNLGDADGTWDMLGELTQWQRVADKVYYTSTVGIGTSSPSSDAKLQVHGNLYHSTGSLFSDFIRPYSGNQLTFLAGGSNYAYFNGNVGIGTTSPDSPLHIETANRLGTSFTGTTHGEGVIVNQTNYVAGNYVSLIESGYDDAEEPNVRIGARFKSTGSDLVFGTSNAYASGITNTAMLINETGNVGIGTLSPLHKLQVGAIGTTTTLGTMAVSSDASGYAILIEEPSQGAETWGIGLDADGDLNFYDSGSSTPSVVFNDGGNVGIGTTSPVAKLDVQTADGSAIDMIISHDDIGMNEYIGLGFRGYTGGSGSIKSAIVKERTGSYGTGKLHFLNETTVDDSNADLSDAVMTIAGSSVGIGTTSPTQKLDVNGNISGSSGRAVLRDNSLENHATNADSNVAVNYFGYAAGTTQFRDFNVFDGKENLIASFDGSTARVGIGTSSPSKKLDVAGDWKLDGISGGYFSNYDYGAELNISEISSGSSYARANRITTNDSTGTIFYGAYGTSAGLQRSYWTIGNPASDATGYTFSNGIILQKDGNVGIGTVTPDEKLEVEGSGTTRLAVTSTGGATVKIKAASGNGYLATSTNANLRFQINDADKMILDTSGQVGIGTTSPDEMLHIANTSGGSSILLEAASGSSSNLLFGDGDSNVSGRVRYDHVANDIALWTNGAERVTVTSTGSVGIGTTSPASKLEVNGDIQLQRTNEIIFGETVGGNPRAVIFSTENEFSSDYNGLGFSVANNTRTSPSMYIRSDGKVGIGTTSPSEKLHVDGNVRIQGDLTVNGSYTQIDTNTSTTEQWSVTNDGTGPAVIVNQVGNQPIMRLQDDGTTVVEVGDNGDITLSGGDLTLGSGSYQHLARSSYITFYGDNSPNHSIGSRNKTYGSDDDLRINTYGALLINLDSNDNNTSDASFEIGRHGGTGTISDWLFKVDGESGNVGIGTTNPNAQLSLVTTTNTTPPGLGSLGSQFLMTKSDGGANGNYGLLAGVSGSGWSWFQAQRVDGTATAYNLILQPSGGDVGIGTDSPSTRLHIVEDSTATALTVSNTSSNGTVVKLTSTGDNRNLYLQTDHIYSDGNLYFGDNSYETIIRGSFINVENDLKTKGNLYLNWDNTAASSYVYFGDASSDTGHSLSFSDSTQTFTLTDSIAVSGGVTATGMYINNTSGESVLKFGPGIPSNDDAHIEWRGTSNSGTLRISTSDDNGTENIELGDYDNTGRGGTFTQWANFRRSAIDFNTDLRIYQSGLANSGTHDLLTLEGNIGDVTADPVKVAIKFKLQDSNNATNEARISMATVNDTDYGENNEATNNLIFSTSSVGTLTDKMIITGPGNVGIGNTNPAEKLDVYGDIKGQEIVLSNSSNVEKARMIYDATSETIKFTFA